MPDPHDSRSAAPPEGVECDGRSFWTGIGSRRTPDDALELLTALATALRLRDWTLRSGHAPGADQACEAGAREQADIFLPWRTFEVGVPILGQRYESPTPAAYELAAEHHPNWLVMRRGGQALHARNGHQVLGWDLQTPSRFVACWTPDGLLDGRGPDTGGTGQALRLAAAFNVPVFNLQRGEHRSRVQDWLSTLA